jgi:hypothetical protein
MGDVVQGACSELGSHLQLLIDYVPIQGQSPATRPVVLLHPAGPNSHTVADRIGRTNIPLARGRTQEDVTILPWRRWEPCP